MPIYTYQCENCGVRFERHQNFSDPVLTQCPECMEETLRKVYTPVGIVFKGSGFYSTDNRSPSGTRHAKESSKESSQEKSTSETKKEEKKGKADTTKIAKED